MRQVAHFALSFLTTLAVQVAAQDGDSGTVWATPHDSYSSSVGVLGCKVNTDRIAYWPGSVDCNNVCVSLSYGGRSVKLLRIDQSGGAHDVSYDAWNYLLTGFSATKKPTAGGATAMEYEALKPSACSDLIHTDGHKLPFSASNSINFLASCLEQPDSWVAKNYVLYNIQDPLCTWGHDEKCTIDWPNANQPTCPHTLGEPIALTTDPVYNIRYPSGERVLASTGQVVNGANGGSGAGRPVPHLLEMPSVTVIMMLVAYELLALLE
ncbi:hypothetical protein F5Y19DRAFT_454741 [Xylariaceae sp. FL1651]|nr:hypothetical protein F5Y19DRAFT_454741 [Xylariaceae sp. FL1651]